MSKSEQCEVTSEPQSCSGRKEPLDRIIIECDAPTQELWYLNTCGSGIRPGSHAKVHERNSNGIIPGDGKEQVPGSPLSPDEENGKTIVSEYQDIETGCWYQTWDAVIRWYTGRPVNIRIAMNITAKIRIETQIMGLGELRERLFTPQPLIAKLQDISQTAIHLFDLELSCIWLFEHTHDLSQISHLHDHRVADVHPEKHYLRHIFSSSGTDEMRRFTREISAVSGCNTEYPQVPEVVEVYDQEALYHALHEFVVDNSGRYQVHHSPLYPLKDTKNHSIGYMCFFKRGGFQSEMMPLIQTLIHITSQVIIADLDMQAHHRTMEKYQVLMDNLPQGVFLKDIEGRYISCNKQFACDAAIPWHSIYGKTDSDIFPAPLACLSSEMDTRVIYRKETSESILEFVQDEKTRWIESIRTPLTDANGEITGILGIMHDITRRKLAEEELQCLYNELEVRVEARTEELLQTQEAYRQANRKLNLLNSITRHDILNQITALYGYLELAQESVTDDSVQGYLDRAGQSARVIHDQITFTKLYQDIGVHAPIWQSLYSVISRVMKGFSPEGITISMNIRNTEVYADPLLEKVFYTLIDNSIRHGKGLTYLSFGKTITSDTLTIVYEDDGGGIEPEQKCLIFQRGFGKNTGLGLFLAAEILNITGSSITETGCAGTGARFEIVFLKHRFRIVPE